MLLTRLGLNLVTICLPIAFGQPPFCLIQPIGLYNNNQISIFKLFSTITLKKRLAQNIDIIVLQCLLEQLVLK